MDPQSAIRTLAAVDIEAPPEVHAAAALLPIVGEFKVATSTVADLRADLAAGKVRPEDLRDRLYVAAIDVEQQRRYSVANDVTGPIIDRAKEAIAARGNVMFDQLRARFDPAVAVLTSALVEFTSTSPNFVGLPVEFELPRSAEVDTAEAEVRADLAARRLLGACGWGPRGEDVSWYIAHPGNHTRVIEASRVWNEWHTITSLMSYGFEPHLNTVAEVDAIVATRANKPGVRRSRNRFPEAPPVETREPVVR
jgi:hypothetical protein